MTEADAIIITCSGQFRYPEMLDQMFISKPGVRLIHKVEFIWLLVFRKISLLYGGYSYGAMKSALAIRKTRSVFGGKRERERDDLILTQHFRFYHWDPVAKLKVNWYLTEISFLYYCDHLHSYIYFTGTYSKPYIQRHLQSIMEFTMCPAPCNIRSLKCT